MTKKAQINFNVVSRRYFSRDEKLNVTARVINCLYAFTYKEKCFLLFSCVISFCKLAIKNRSRRWEEWAFLNLTKQLLLIC
jgi:hypothetical protein